MENELQAQKALAEQEAQASRSNQDVLARKLKEAQENIQATVSQAQKYETQIGELGQKMAAMEQLLVGQRQKGQQLESQLSAAQDRIGGAERRAQLLEQENVKIKGELQSWNDYYNQEETSPETPVSAPVSTSIPDSTPLFPMFAPFGLESTIPPPNIPEPVFPFQTPAASSSVPLPGWQTVNAENIEQRQDGGRRVSFGSVFPGSNGNGGSGQRDSIGGPQGHNVQGSGSSTFNIGIKPKDPPFFHGRASEDVDT